ncbi:MAG: hypothetical protein RLZZ546_462, partial [Bacteroidota bacterium]|jgi:sugar lactone lactonase YvrE
MKSKTILFLSILSFLLACKSEKKSEKRTSIESEKKDTIAATGQPSLTFKWSTDTLLKTPESVIHHNGNFYVSCIGNVPPEAKDKDGYIAIVDGQGKITNQKWISGLNGPKGMGIKGDSLYVTDVDQLVIIEISKSKIVKRIPIKGAKFLNDIDISENGIVYISDTYTNTIHYFDGKEIKPLIVNEALGNPNGIYSRGDVLTVSSFGKAEVYTIDTKNPSVIVKTDSLQGGDGVEAYLDGYLVSNWNGEIYFI